MNRVKRQQALRLFFRKTFDIREGELERSLLMQGNIFLIITTLLIVKPTVNALFLEFFGVENLPFAFVSVALFAGAISLLYARLLNRIGFGRLMINTLYIFILSFVAFGVFLYSNRAEGLIIFLFYIWVAIFALLSTSQFWILSNIVFNAREAKRLFGFIGAGAIAGGVFGGYLTSILAQFISSEWLAFVAAACLSLCVPITRRIWNQEVKEKQTLFQEKKKARVIADHPFKIILQSRHLSYVAAIVGISVVVAKLVDYQFSAIASALIPDTDELTAFFGFWFSTFNLVSLLMQLFITRRVVGTFGVGSSLLFLPASILLAAGLLLISPEWLLAAVILKMADAGLKQSVNKSAMELIIMPVAQEIKNQTKTFIDVFMDSVATGLSGLMLIFLIKGLDLSIISVTMLIIGFILLWIFLVYKVRGSYFYSFRQKIKPGRSKDKPKIKLLDESVIGGMKKVLKNGSDQQVLFVLKKIKENPDDRFFDSIKPLIHHPNNEIRAEAIHNLYFYPKYNLSDEIEILARDPAQKVKIAVIDYLLAHATTEQLDPVKSYLAHPDYKIRYAALVSLARETRNNPRLRQLFEMGSALKKGIVEVDQLPDPQVRKFCTIGLLKAIGYSGITELYPFIADHLESKDRDYLEQAIKSAGDTFHPRFIDPLLPLLADPAYQEIATQALLNYGKGILDVFIRMAGQKDTPLNVRRALPSVIKWINAQKSVDFLLSMVNDQDRIVRQEVLRGLNHLKNSFPHLNFPRKAIVRQIFNEAQLHRDTLVVLYRQTASAKDPESTSVAPSDELIQARKELTSLLEKRLDKNLERIFRLLGLKYASADIQSIYEGLQSNREDIRLSAIEFLDNLLEPGLKKVLIPLIETTMLENITEEAIRQLNIKIPQEEECLRLLLDQQDQKVKYAVLFLIRQLRDPAYIPMLESYRPGASPPSFGRILDELIALLKNLPSSRFNS